MTEAEQLAYFTGVLRQIDALREQPNDNSVLSRALTEAGEAIASLVGCLIPDGPR